MRLVKYLVLSATLYIAVALPSSGQGQPFSVVLQPTDPIKAGTEVRVGVTTTNTSDHAIRFAKAFGNEEFDFEIDVRDAQGKTPPLTDSYRDLKEHPTSRWGSYSTYVLEPGKSLEEELVVTKLYILNRPGKYTISVTRGQRPMWQILNKDKEKSSVKSNTITVTVNP